MKSIVARSLPAFAIVLLAASLSAAAAPRMASLLPAGTVGFVATPDVPALVQRWRTTQLGLFVSDKTMRPFVEQVEARINSQLGGLEERLGVTLEDLESCTSGELAIALVESKNENESGHAVALLDSSGREAEAKAMLAKVDAKLKQRGGKASPSGEVTLYSMPADSRNKLPARTAAVFQVGGLIGFAETSELADTVISLIKGQGGESLATLAPFAETQQRAIAAADGATVNLQWFVSPFAYEAAMREPAKSDALPDDKNTLAILAEQGFDAIQGIGGVVTVAATPERDFVHHTFVYAPPKPGTEGQAAKDRYELAMRMLELPNAAAELDPAAPPVESWAPRQVAKYTTQHLDFQNAFDHLGTLFDAFFYDGAFETTLTGWERDYYGPKVNVRTEVIPHLGKRMVVMTDYMMPITPECERYLLAIDVTNEEALRDPVNRWLKNEPGSERKTLNDVEYWELTPEDEAVAIDDLDPLAPIGDTAPQQAGEERVLQHAAVCLHQNRLLIASDADFLRQALFGLTSTKALAGSADLSAAVQALKEIAPGERCAWGFTRTDEAFRPTYELVRSGEMPKSQTFFGRLLNRVLRSDEQREVDAMREQKIDGHRLPTFELARRYFGPSARSVKSHDDGWLVSGVLLSKAPSADAPATSVARAK